jgi:hypothetical protein
VFLEKNEDSGNELGQGRFAAQKQSRHHTETHRLKICDRKLSGGETGVLARVAII